MIRLSCEGSACACHSTFRFPSTCRLCSKSSPALLFLHDRSDLSVRCHDLRDSTRTGCRILSGTMTLILRVMRMMTRTMAWTMTRILTRIMKWKLGPGFWLEY